MAKLDSTFRNTSDRKLSCQLSGKGFNISTLFKQNRLPCCLEKCSFYTSAITTFKIGKYSNVSTQWMLIDDINTREPDRFVVWCQTDTSIPGFKCYWCSTLCKCLGKEDFWYWGVHTIAMHALENHVVWLLDSHLFAKLVNVNQTIIEQLNKSIN
jgi:hypothetical protein